MEVGDWGKHGSFIRKFIHSYVRIREYSCDPFSLYTDPSPQFQQPPFHSFSVVKPQPADG